MRGLMALGASCLFGFGAAVAVAEWRVIPSHLADAEARERQMAVRLYQAECDLRSAKAEADALRRAATRPDPAGGGRIAPPDPPLPVE